MIKTKTYVLGVLSIGFLLYACSDGPVTGTGPENPDPVATVQQGSLNPVSGGDGEYEIIEVNGMLFYRSVQPTVYLATYMYFQSNVEVKNRTGFVRIFYKDNGTGSLTLQYNSTGNDHESADAIYGTTLANTQGVRMAVLNFPMPIFDLHKI